MRRVLALAALLMPIALVEPGAQSTDGLPDKSSFLAEARKRLAGNDVLQSRYTYRERVSQMRYNPLGRIGTGPVDTYEIYPIAEDFVYRRLIARSGAPVPREQLADADRQFMTRYQQWRRKLFREGQSERDERRRRLAAEQQKDRTRAEEAIGLFEFNLERRDTFEGQPAIVVAFHMRPGARPVSREAKIASSFSGRAWVHEYEHEVMRVEAEAVNDTTFGFGIVAKLNKGTTAVFTRRKLLGSWLPVETRVNGTGRALLFRKVTIDFVREYSDYRPFESSDLPNLLAVSKGSN